MVQHIPGTPDSDREADRQGPRRSPGGSPVWRTIFEGADDLQHATDRPFHRPAIRYGWHAGLRHGDRPFEAVAPVLERDWDPAAHGLSWAEARPIIRAAYVRAARGGSGPARSRVS